jgi:hypothetical protein
VLASQCTNLEPRGFILRFPQCIRQLSSTDVTEYTMMGRILISKTTPLKVPSFCLQDDAV